MNILAIDNDAEALFELCDVLDMMGFEVSWATSLSQALAQGDWSRLTAILLDRSVADGPIGGLVRRLGALAPHASILVSAEYSGIESLRAAVRGGAAGYFLKPIDPCEVSRCLVRIVQLRKAEDRAMQAVRLASLAQRLSDDILRRCAALVRQYDGQFSVGNLAVRLLKQIDTSEKELSALLEGLRASPDFPASRTAVRQPAPLPLAGWGGAGPRGRPNESMPVKTAFREQPALLAGRD